MKHLAAVFFIVVLFCSFAANAQVVSVVNPANTTPALSATYPSLSNAITALDGITAISGPVTIILNTGNPQTAPAGGYTINFANLSNTAASPVTFTGNNNTITAFTPQSNGLFTDAIFKIVGADYITIENFTMQENPANTNATPASNNMTEWGVALLYASATNGAQNNTIQNNSISLNKAYSNTFGIYSNTRHTASNVLTSADITNGTTGPNKGNKVYGNSISNVNMGITFIGVPDIANMDIGNDIGGTSAATGNTITNWGGAAPAQTGFISNSGSYHCIFTNHQKDDNISYNTITSSTITGTSGQTRGIFKGYRSASPSGSIGTTSTISNNTITITNNLGNSSALSGIAVESMTPFLTTATINITNNLLLNNSVNGASSGNMITGISNSAAPGVLNINNNIIRGTTSTASTVTFPNTAGFMGISNTGIVSVALNINNNQVGNAAGNAITFSAASSGQVIGIISSAAGTAASVSISNNNFQGIVHTVSGSGAQVYISSVHAPNAAVTDNINGNTFTNLTARTTANVTFISRSGIMTALAGATENCNNNSIVTGFSKTLAGGSVSIYSAMSGSLSGNSMVQTGNDFSNITLTGATIMNGWVNTEGFLSGATKTISNNTFSNWVCGTSPVYVIQSDFGGNGTTISNNNISNISCTGTGTLTGIIVGPDNRATVQSCTGNTISGLTAGTGSAIGIVNNSQRISTMEISGNRISGLSALSGSMAGLRILNGIAINIFKNKIYDIAGTGTGSFVYGIEEQSTNTGACNIYNNLVGDIRATAANSPDAINGMLIASVMTAAAHNIYYNTIYLNATSTGTNFGSAGIFLTASGSPGNGTTTLRNNIIVNNSTANGTGLTVAYRRNIAQLANYASASNNNIFYAGIPSATNVIFSDFSTSDQTLVAFKSRVAPRDAASFTELPPFLSTTGSAANFLHLNPAAPTQAESGAVNIGGITDDFDANIRQGNAGYTGAGTRPDIGADEVEAIPTELDPPVIAYSTLPTPTCSYTGNSVTGVVITDATGIPLTGTTRPRIYYRKNAGTWFSQPGTFVSGSATNSTWNFNIIETDLGTLTGGDIISYYVIAQDLVTTPNVGSNPAAGMVASSVNTVSTHPSAPNSYVLGYNLSGLYTVGNSGDFATLTAAVSAYNNACSLAGNVVFELIDNSYPAEVFPVTVQLHPDANATHTLTIRPSASAVPLITGAVANPNPVFSLNGGKYITIDGRQGGVGPGKFLTIANTGTGMTILLNNAQNDAIKYCVVKGQHVAQFEGTITLRSTGGLGNDNIIIDHNDITDAGGQSTNGIYSSVTGSGSSDNNSVTNNNISNYFDALNSSAGIYITNNANSWTITGNRLFQTATRLYTATKTHFGIYVTSGTGYVISNNVIGYANAGGTGTTNMIGNSTLLAGFPGAYTPSGTAFGINYVAIGGSFSLVGTASAIDGNQVGGFAMYTSNATPASIGMFCGIYIESGTANIGVNAGNTIGSATSTNSIYVATSGAGGAIVGIRAACTGISSINNNIIGGITASGTSAALTGGFTGISIGGVCNFTLNNNSIGNETPDNIRLGYTVTAGQLSNTGTLATVNPTVTAFYKGIASAATGNSLVMTNNSFRGWTTSCISTQHTGIESAGGMIGGGAVISVNNNAFGTVNTNWLNSTVENDRAIYAINISNTGAAAYNIKNNAILGQIFSTQTSSGGGLIRLSGATAANNVATISGNSFTNLNFRMAGGALYFIYTAYNLPSTGQLIIDNNRILGNFTTTGNGEYHMIQCQMGSAAGAILKITNNDFSNFVAGTGFRSDCYGIYSTTGGNACNLTISNNVLSNWAFGTGSMVGIEISPMTGTASCHDNLVSNINCQGDIEGISTGTSGNSGIFDIYDNTLSSLTSSNVGGYINGISVYIPTGVNTTQTNITHNLINGLSSTNITGIIAGIFLNEGHSSATVAVSANKIYNLSESASNGRVYGIYNHTTTAGTITYRNNYIGDLRAPASTATNPVVAGMKLLMTAGEARIYYNTIHLNAVGSPAQFSTAAIQADAATAVTLRNNIFSNVSAPGSAGRTVAYWRSGINLATYNATSNNNLFFAGTVSAKNLLFYDGTNADQTLTAYQARVTPRDNRSVSALPVFVSLTGSSAGYLHLAEATNCEASSGGNNAGILLDKDYDGDNRSVSSPYITDIGADEVTKLHQWTGANNTNWNDAGNWSQAIVPNAADINVFISSLPVNQPVVAAGDVFQVSNLIVENGATLNNRGTLKIAGSIFSAPAGINNIEDGVVTGSVEMNGNCSAAQVLAGNCFADNSVKNFTVSNNMSVSAISGEHLNISRELAFGSVSGKTLVTGGNVVLRSTFSGTANVADVTGNNISGAATVERYINTGALTDGRHGKTWQFLATPTQGQTIYQAWQENGATPAGYGTIITGTGNGFDITTAAPSMKFFDPAMGANGDWAPVTNTGSQLNNPRGYMLFVRGDRSITDPYATANTTNIRSKGILYQPNTPPPVSVIPAGKISAIGNPYASAVDLDFMKNNGAFTNLNNDVVVWDPLLVGTFNYGGYQTLSAANDYEPTAGGTAFYPSGIASPIIQSGQAFFMRSSGPAGTVTFTETCKESGSRLVNKIKPVGTKQYFRAGLYTNNGLVADGNAVVFATSYRNSIDADDAVKQTNSGENFSLSRLGKTLSVEARNILTTNDTIFYAMANLRKQAYQLRFAPKNISANGLGAYLIDRFLNSSTEISLTDSSFINILITNDAGSFAPGRFFVIFKKRPVPVLITSENQHKKLIAGEAVIPVNKNAAISVYPNPVEHKTIRLNFINQAFGAYHLRLINALGQPVYSSDLKVNAINFSAAINIGAGITPGNYLLLVSDGKGLNTTIKLFIN